VYCNGKDYEPSRRVVLTKRMLSRGSLSDVFAEISQHIAADFGVVTKYVVYTGPPDCCMCDEMK